MTMCACMHPCMCADVCVSVFVYTHNFSGLDLCSEIIKTRQTRIEVSDACADRTQMACNKTSRRTSGSDLVLTYLPGAPVAGGCEFRPVRPGSPGLPAILRARLPVASSSERSQVRADPVVAFEPSLLSGPGRAGQSPLLQTCCFAIGVKSNAANFLI